jgi:hypothetical protein
MSIAWEFRSSIFFDCQRGKGTPPDFYFIDLGPQKVAHLVLKYNIVFEIYLNYISKLSIGTKHLVLLYLSLAI